MPALDPKQPVFEGLEVYRDLTHRFSLLYPTGWVCRELPTREQQEKPSGGQQAKQQPKQQHGGKQGDRRAICLPDPAEPDSFLLIQSRRLRTTIQPDDLDELREGMRDGLESLPGAEVESLEGETVGDLITLEAHHTFREGDAVRRRWTRLLYQGTVQLGLTAQGATEERFAYWRPMFNTIMRTVKFTDWWAEMTGVSWKRQAYKVPRRARTNTPT